MEKVKGNQSRILRYILDTGEVSKAQLSKDLNLSMPTVLQSVKIFSEHGVICEAGSYESTGGRKAKALAVNGNWRYSVGVDITKNHVAYVLINMQGQVLKAYRGKRVFQNSMIWFNEVASEIDKFIQDAGVEREKILGIGVSLPGIINRENTVLLKSHALNVENVNLKNLVNAVGLPIYFENDANSALMAEKTTKQDTVAYLSLSNTVGGAIAMQGELFRGNDQRTGEFGHMTLYPDGKRCYCGKIGCVDAYCSALVLKTEETMTLEEFMSLLKSGDEACKQVWDKYLDDLALTITNIRMALDIDIILGGYVGRYLGDYMYELGVKIAKQNIFESDISFLRNCVFGREVSAVGVAKYFINQYVENIQFE